MDIIEINLRALDEAQIEDLKETLLEQIEITDDIILIEAVDFIEDYLISNF